MKCENDSPVPEMGAHGVGRGDWTHWGNGACANQPTANLQHLLAVVRSQLLVLVLVLVLAAPEAPEAQEAL